MSILDIEKKAVTSPPQIRTIELTRPLVWLKKGWADLKTALIPSLAYGFSFSVIGILMMWFAMSNPVWSASLMAAFLLMGPFLAVGLYELSRQIEHGEKPCLLDTLKSLRKNMVSLGIFVVVLGFLLMIWMRLAALVGGIYFDNLDLITKGWSVLFSGGQTFEFILFFTFFGFFIANLVFSISVVAIPMIIHRRVDVVTAISTSLRAVIQNPLPLLVWAVLIVTLIHIGFLFAFIGLTVTLPIIGHASWHAYRDLVEEV